MSFREKRAWASFVILLLMSIIYSYFLIRTVHFMEPEQIGEYILLHILFVALLVFVLLEFILYLVLKKLSPHDGGNPKDEREQQIEYRATKIAYTAFIILSIIAAALVVHHPAGGVGKWLTGHIVLSSIAFAQLIKYGMQIFYYRRES